MNTDRDCGCKSFRTCFVCEKQYGIISSDTTEERIRKFDQNFVFDVSNSTIFKECQPSENSHFCGIKIIEDFVSCEEESQLVQDLDTLPWTLSQSGRRKQNYGPKANFKKKKVKPGHFDGFPKCTKFIQDRFSTVPSLEDYKTVEQCSIEYRPETGSRIEPHIDDCWIWGERIVQLNLLSDCFLTLMPYYGGNDRFNLDDVATFPRILNDDGDVIFNPFKNKFVQSEPYRLKCKDDLINGIVRIPLPRRSLLLLYGQPRYDWEHCIVREDIKNRRIVIAYRELTLPYLPGGTEDNIGKEILERAKHFW